MSSDYLNERDAKVIEASQKMLADLPDYVRTFYDSKRESKAELTRSAYVKDIRDFLAYLAPMHHEEVKTFPSEILDRLTPQDINEYKNVLIDKYKGSSVKRKLASLSTFYKYLVICGITKSNPAAIIDWPAEDNSKVIVTLDDEQTAKLLAGIYNNDKQLYYLNEDGEYAESSIKGKGAVKGVSKNKHTEYEVKAIDPATKARREKVRLRNYCITLLFLKTGVRVSELVSIDLDDIDFKRTIIYVTGKGNKTRPVGYGEPEIVAALNEYINVERKALTAKPNHRDEKALFVSSRGNRISVDAVECMIKEMVQTYLADDEYIKHNDFSPHKLRSTCATRLLKETGNIAGVSEFLGHNSIEITARRYAAISQENNSKEMEKVRVLPE